MNYGAYKKIYLSGVHDTSLESPPDHAVKKRGPKKKKRVRYGEEYMMLEVALPDQLVKKRGRKKKLRVGDVEKNMMLENCVEREASKEITEPLQHNARAEMEDGGCAVTLTDSVEEISLYKCEICHKAVSHIGSHVVKHHQFSVQLYKKFFPKVKYQRKTNHR
jgi:hypothetical protein